MDSVPPPAILRILTWNLNGLEPTLLDERTEAQCLAMLLRDDAPHVVMLQEVVARTWHAHLKHHFAAAGFVPVPADPHLATEHDYFCVLLVHRSLPIARSGAELFPNSFMGRHLVWAEATWGERTVLLATSHLESTKSAGQARVAQLAAVVEGLVNHPGPAVFGGDTNLRKAEEPEVAGLERVADAWVDIGEPAEQRATWPSVPRDGRPGARFDRVYVHDAEVVGFRLLGTTAPGFPRPPSDHLAVEVLVAPAP